MDGLEMAEYVLYWETKKFFEAVELQASLESEFDSVVPSYMDSIISTVGDCHTASSTSSENAGVGSGCPDEGSSDSSTMAKNVIMERKRRKSINDKLFALRSVVPNISKMDKISVIRDAIDYILKLQEEERRILSEMPEMAAFAAQSTQPTCHNQCNHPSPPRRKKRRTMRSTEPCGASIEVIQLQVNEVGNETSHVSLTCRKKDDTMARVCEVFESLNLKVLSANIASFSGRLLHDLLVGTSGMRPAQLKEKIELAIAELDAPGSPTSFWATRDLCMD